MIVGSPQTAAQLWQLAPAVFNEWRRNNDLPHLFQFFCDRIDHFRSWLEEYAISAGDFILAPHTGDWFIGELQREFREYPDERPSRYAIVGPEDKQARRGDAVRTIRFLPFLAWGRHKAGKDRFILADRLNRQYSTTIDYRLWASALDGTNTEAHLLKDFRVLKLGETTVGDATDFGNRNLDFVDLDSLVIPGERHGSFAVRISFSSCRFVRLEQASIHHWTFHSCPVEELEVKSSRIYEVTLQSCDCRSPIFVDSTVSGLRFSDTDLSAPVFDKVDLQRITYDPPARLRSYAKERDVHRRFRIAFQATGRMAEARHHYYQERCSDRKANWSPYLGLREEFPSRRYAGRLHQLYASWRSDDFSTRAALILAAHLFYFHLRIWTNPRYLFRTARYKIRYLMSLVEWVGWGYGERPFRIMSLSAVVISAFAGLQYLLGPDAVRSSVVDAFYFSVVTFTTLGYGDILPVTATSKILCAIEALSGALCLGLLIGSIANRSKY